MIPMVDLQTQYKKLEAEMKPAVEKVLSTAAYINGPDVKAFEGEMAAFLGTPHAVACANGTDALHIAMRALGIGPGDEVITTTFTFIATGGMISMAGATPVLVDIDPQSYNIDPAVIEAAITPRTKAIIPVHLFGNPAPMDEIMEIAARHNLAVIEDCAQSTGATYKGRTTGTIGTIGCFSFFPSKNLGCAGDGGMVVSNDAEIAARMRAIASHGSKVKYHNDIQGFNSRLDTVQAAILRVKLPHLAAWNKRRREVAHRYNQVLAGTGIVTPSENPDGVHVFHQYTLRHPERDRLQKVLTDAGISCMIYYPIPMHLQGMYAHLGYKEGSLPKAEAAAREVFSLPVCPELSDESIDYIGKVLREALAPAATAS